MLGVVLKKKPKAWDDACFDSLAELYVYQGTHYIADYWQRKKGDVWNHAINNRRTDYNENG